MLVEVVFSRTNTYVMQFVADDLEEAEQAARRLTTLPDPVDSKHQLHSSFIVKPFPTSEQEAECRASTPL